jgi:chromosome segregation ATPase
MGKNRLVIRLLIILVLTISLAGCKDDKKQKALVEEIARAKAEAIKFKAETVQLKSEISYLNEKLVTANQARDNMQIQLDQVIKDSNAAATNEDNIQQENDKFRKLLADQLKKNNELEKQVETLRMVIREFQFRTEPNKTEPNKIAELPPTPIEETALSK